MNLSYRDITVICKRITKLPLFNLLVVAAIIFSGVVVGIETYPEYVAEYGPTLNLLDSAILVFFTVEIFIRFLARGRNPKLYFMSPWNMFDLVIVGACWLPSHPEYLLVLRLFRILRVLRLMSVLPGLQVLVGALISSIPSIGYIGVLLLIQMFTFGAIGVVLFGQNDPVHFGNISLSMFALFEVITLEGWVDLYKIQAYGSAEYPELFENIKVVSSAQPVTAAVFFISFILIGTMIVLNLFVAVILKAVEEQAEEVNMERLLKKAHHGGLPLDEQIEMLALQVETLKEGLGMLRARVHEELKPYRALKKLDRKKRRSRRSKN